MAGHSCWIAFTSAGRRVARPPQPRRTPLCVVEPGRMTNELAPRLAIFALIDACAPCPMATMAMTAPTPMITPSMVRLERIRLRPNARCAILMAMSMRTTWLPPAPLKAQWWRTRRRRRPRRTAAAFILVHDACHYLLPFPEAIADEFSELVVANP